MEIIRVTTREELEQCFEIRMDVFVREQNVSVEEEIDEYDESPEACRHLLIRKNGLPVATGRFRGYDDKTAKLQRIAVRKEERGSGTGRALMAALEEWAAEEGYGYAVLDAQTHAEGFYGRNGYATVSPEIFLDAGIPHVRMKKTLGAE